MIKLPEDLYQIKKHHTMAGKVSVWTGMNKGGKMPGSAVDKLRTNLSMESWNLVRNTLEHRFEEYEHKGHFNNTLGEQYSERVGDIAKWERATLSHPGWERVGPYYYPNDYGHYIRTEQPAYKEFRAILWSFMTLFCEVCEYLGWEAQLDEDPQDFDNKLFDFGPTPIFDKYNKS